MQHSPHLLPHSVYKFKTSYCKFYSKGTLPLTQVTANWGKAARSRTISWKKGRNHTSPNNRHTKMRACTPRTRSTTSSTPSLCPRYTPSTPATRRSSSKSHRPSRTNPSKDRKKWRSRNNRVHRPRRGALWGTLTLCECGVIMIQIWHISPINSPYSITWHNMDMH